MRTDLEIIASLVTPRARVMDIGCGEGELLSYLIATKNVDGRGIEISQTNVSTCVAKGLSVIQGDADTDLRFYPDKSFDYVILTSVLQATEKPRDVLEHMLRIGKNCIVSFPNFGQWRNRLYLALNGRMPVTKALPYEWHNTPNIHFCTIRDFIALADELGARILAKHFISPSGKEKHYAGLQSAANFFAREGVFLLSK